MIDTELTCSIKTKHSISSRYAQVLHIQGLSKHLVSLSSSSLFLFFPIVLIVIDDHEYHPFFDNDGDIDEDDGHL